METVPFVLNGLGGDLAIDYRRVEHLEDPGFDMFDPMEFDPELAIGYPRLHTWVESYQGSGYRTASALIQWIDTERVGPRHMSVRELDVSEEYGAANIPFFAHGYPAAMFDAPAHNMNGASWMRWEATTWFVASPARWTNHLVRPIVGFRWGYEEDSGEVSILPLKPLQIGDWSATLPWLRDQCATFGFADAN
jgi:hypothetical protein